MGLYDFQRPAQDDPAWQLLVEHAWDYQWVRHVEPLTPGIAATLYDLTQGVTDFLIKLLVLGQRHAIQTGQERLTLELLEHVANTRLKLLKPAIAALRDVDPRSLLRFEDLLPTDVQIESMMTPAPSARAANRHLQVLRTLRKQVHVNEAGERGPQVDSVAPAHGALAAGSDSMHAARQSITADSANTGEPLRALYEAGWLTTDALEFSPLYKGSSQKMEKIGR
jgi:hypothetical protein